MTETPVPKLPHYQGFAVVELRNGRLMLGHVQPMMNYGVLVVCIDHYREPDGPPIRHLIHPDYVAVFLPCEEDYVLDLVRNMQEKRQRAAAGPVARGVH